MLKLVSKETYDLKMKLTDEPEEKWPIFTMKKLTAGEVNIIDDQVTGMSGTPGASKVFLLVGTSRKLKVQYALKNWKNILDDQGAEVPCTPENKEKLPSEVQMFLEEHINEVNGLKGVSREVEKNS